MTEGEARDWLVAHCSTEQFALLERFVAILLAEADRQSLIARSTFGTIWARHIVDSAQLAELVDTDGNWLDVGSGGGLPGIVLAILRDAPITLCEPRRKRADFLVYAIDRLGLGSVSVCAMRVQDLAGRFAIVSARAVAPIDDILTWTMKLVSRETRFVLQRGRNWQEDVALARHSWHGAFHVEQSITDPDAGIVVAHGVSRK